MDFRHYFFNSWNQFTLKFRVPKLPENIKSITPYSKLILFLFSSVVFAFLSFKSIEKNTLLDWLEENRPSTLWVERIILLEGLTPIPLTGKNHQVSKSFPALPAGKAGFLILEDEPLILVQTEKGDWHLFGPPKYLIKDPKSLNWEYLEAKWSTMEPLFNGLHRQVENYRTQLIAHQKQAVRDPSELYF